MRVRRRQLACALDCPSDLDTIHRDQTRSAIPANLASNANKPNEKGIHHRLTKDRRTAATGHAGGCRYRNRHDAGGQAIPRVIPGVLGQSEQIRRHRSRFSNKSALLSGDGRRRHRCERARLWLDLYDSATEDGNNAKGRGAYARSAGTCATTCCQDDLMFDIKRRDRQRGGSVAAPGARTAAGPHAAH